MKIICCFDDLRPFGIHCLTGEACGLMLRILFDLTTQGKAVVEKCFDISLTSEAWNGGSEDDPHVASIMLTREMLMPIGIFAVLESGCLEVYLNDQVLYGIEKTDNIDDVERLKRREGLRRYAYHGTAGSRNKHVFTGRIV